ncbi:hypothetical protein Taro_000135 [Colocasia esculenta]|uniref:CUE domain-containing protein n=1 Tax=Colocasia esculenta TaxID=4460 RepID=A0A843TCA4_COLES|nr:hypothetical protein [Colocasia esculenta]
MSAGICGKRLGFEEIFGSAPAPPSAKRSRCARYGSPIRPLDLGLGSDDKVSFLLRMFPSMDREVVETILNAHDHKIDDAIKSLHALCLGDVSVRNEALGQSAALVPDEHVEDGLTSEQRVDDLQNNQASSEPGLPHDGSLWVDAFLQEVMKASNWDDARGRVTQILEAFERSVITNSRASEELEIATLKEQLQCLLRDNQILKRAVAIQHERNVEHEEKLKEVQQLKHVISQYQEQVRNLELSNYTLKIHLQKAQEANSIPSHFHPDIF